MSIFTWKGVLETQSLLFPNILLRIQITHTTTQRYCQNVYQPKQAGGQVTNLHMLNIWIFFWQSLFIQAWKFLPFMSSEVHCPAWRMPVNAREWRNNASQVALPTILSVTKARSNARRAGRSFAFKKRWQMCFPIFRTSRSRSFVFMQTFSLFLLLTDKTRTAIKVIYLLISEQFIFFHALWMAIFRMFYFSQQ